MAYFHMTGEKPVDLSIIRSRLLPGTTQVCASGRSPHNMELHWMARPLCSSLWPGFL